MHETFVFPMDCTGSLERWDKSVEFIESEKGIFIFGEPQNKIGGGYDPFEYDQLIPDFIEITEKTLNGETLRKNLKKWLAKWGPLYSVDFDKNTVENFEKESLRFYKLWMLYKSIVNRDREGLLEYVKTEEEEKNYKITFFPGDPIFPRKKYPPMMAALGEPDLEFLDYAFPIPKKEEIDLFEKIQDISMMFVFKEIEKYTNRANLYWNAMTHSKELGKSKYKISPVLKIENLIDAIYLQFYILFSENEKKICPVCNTPFAPVRKDKKYCSDTCKLTAKSRRYRARKTS